MHTTSAFHSMYSIFRETFNVSSLGIGEFLSYGCVHYVTADQNPEAPSR